MSRAVYWGCRATNRGGLTACRSSARGRRLASVLDVYKRQIKGRHRLFMDNAGGSLRLKAAEDEFKRVSEMPDASEHSNELALELLALEDKARIDIKSCLLYTSRCV